MDIVEQQEKRQRLTLTSEKRALTLEGLPQPLLTEIASYLLTTEKEEDHNIIRTGFTGADTLLAVALTASKSSWDKLQYNDTTDINKLLSPASKVVLSVHTNSWWKRYDEFDLSHARSNAITVVDLDDIDLKAILICIDARNNVKSLKLSGCFDISGRGLEPLAGSSVIKKIDLSLVNGNYKRESFDVEQISLCEGIVLPILHSIIEGGSSSLRHVQVPLKWRNGKSTELTRFIDVYNNYLRALERTCQREWDEEVVQNEEWIEMKCENICAMGMHKEGERYGIQTTTCSECLKCFCTDEDCMEEPRFNYCPHCQTYHCSDCNHSDFVVEGCGISDLNGLFKRQGSCDNVPKYVRQCGYHGNDEEFTLFRCKLVDDTR